MRFDTSRRRCCRSAALALFALLLAFAGDARAVTIDWSPVGNHGNAADTTFMTFDGTTGYGSVAYNYRIGTYDVTNSQYVEFLNAKDPSGLNPLRLYFNFMSISGGINYNAGNANGNKYSVISGDGNHPVTDVTWYSAIRFANWLNNGQGNGDTETGAYTLGVLGADGVPSNGQGITRNAGATIFLPSEDEWYKAAYYNPGTNSYFRFPTSSNTTPNASGPTAVPNSANYNSAVGNPTDVGAYTGTTSPYGAFDMGGNVFQWNEALTHGSSRGIRGGSFNTGSNGLLSSFRDFDYDPGYENYYFLGFRVASIPEPSTGVLAVLGAILVALPTYRRRYTRRIQ